MRAAVLMLFAYCLAQLSAKTAGTVNSREWLTSLVDLVEMDYEENCAMRAAAEWEELTGSQKGLNKKLEIDKQLGLFAQKRQKEVSGAYSEQAFGPNDDLLRRKVKLLLQPEDWLLDTEQWIKLVTFSDTAQHKLRFATDYDCGTGTNCTLRELHISMAREQDEKKLLQMKQSWEKNLPNMDEYLEQVLPILRNSSKGYKTVEEYWDHLVEYEGAILKARELWDKVQPLYTKFQKYIALRLRGADHVGKPLPAHLLRSLNGDDWSNVIESLLPKHPAIYQKVSANIQLQNLGGLNAYKSASKLIQSLKFKGEVKSEVWSESIFNSTCPATLVDWCTQNKVRVATCKDANIQNYLDAHETATRILYKQMTALHSTNTYIVREAPRYSAIYEAIPGFVSLLALSPHALDRNGLFPFEIFDINANHHRLILQMIMALRDLPKLNFYLAADEWRIRYLRGANPPNNATSWSEFRKNFSLIESSDVDILSDPYVLSNKPFIGKFMGLILKYQIYQSFAEELESDESDLLDIVASNNDRLSETMMKGFTVKWPELVSDLLAKKENGLEYTGLTDYYQFLDEYLELQFDPTYNEESQLDDYLDPSDINEPPSDEDEFDPANTVTFEEPLPGLDTELEPKHNEIETDEAENNNIETSTISAIPVLHRGKNKNEVTIGPKKDNVQHEEGSYNIYWWIGIGVALSVVVILIAIIARKRHNHRKQLERQRENSHA